MFPPFLCLVPVKFTSQKLLCVYSKNYDLGMVKITKQYKYCF